MRPKPYGSAAPRVVGMERGFTLLVALWGVAAVVGVVSLGLGRYEIALDRVVAILAGALAQRPLAGTDVTVVLTVRLPRVLMAMLAGAGLGLSGAALQGVFRNPLVGPQVIGVSSGAAFGGALAILSGTSTALLLGSAFAFGVVALGAVYGLNARVGRSNLLALVLAGVVVGGFFHALVSLVQYLADADEKLPSIVFWLLGSFANADWSKLRLLAVPVLIGGGLVLALRWRIDLLSLGDDDARSLGVAVERTRWIILMLVASIIAAQVAVSGVIGWVGLVVPHMARGLVGARHRLSLPASAALGALFLTLVDDAARTITSAEIPLGILTALIGTPVFAALLRRAQAGGERG